MKRTVKETTKEYDTEGNLVRESITETTEESNDNITHPSYPYPTNPSWPYSPSTVPNWPGIPWTVSNSEASACSKESLS